MQCADLIIIGLANLHIVVRIDQGGFAFQLGD